MTNVRPTKDELIDLFWRSLWTFISSALGIPIGASLLNIDLALADAMGMAGVTAVVGVVSVFARQKLGTVSVAR